LPDFSFPKKSRSLDYLEIEVACILLVLYIFRSKVMAMEVLRSRFEHFSAFVFDCDDTIGSNHEGTPGHVSIHDFSRLEACKLVAQRSGIAVLNEYPMDRVMVSFQNSLVHTAGGAFWWILQDAGLRAATDRYNDSDELVLAILSAKNEAHPDMIRRYGLEVPGSVALMKKIARAGGKIAIGSTAPHAEILVWRELLGFEDCVGLDNIRAYEHVENHKPHPEVFERATASLDIPPADNRPILVFEDDPRGVEAGKKANDECVVWAVTSRFKADTLAAAKYAPDVVGTYADFDRLLFVA
jgi:beta-phosphoglucomutase-like phosphatase (HAD superfamily)